MKNKNSYGTGEAILSGYVRYRPINGTYYLMINSKRLAEKISLKSKKIKVTSFREKKIFYLHSDQEGNILKPRKRELVTCIKGNTLLTGEERSELKAKGSKFSFTTKIKLFPEEFNLDKYSLYPDKDAANLARSLDSLGFTIPSRVMTPKEFEHDLEASYKDKKIVIEITQSLPGIANYLNFKHQPIGGVVRAHMFDTYRNCVNSVLSGENKTVGFVVIHEKWKTFKHITKLIPELSKVNCYILFTIFKDKWEESCSRSIHKRLSE